MYLCLRFLPLVCLGFSAAIFVRDFLFTAHLSPFLQCYTVIAKSSLPILCLYFFVVFPFWYCLCRRSFSYISSQFSFSLYLMMFPLQHSWSPFLITIFRLHSYHHLFSPLLVTGFRHNFSWQFIFPHYITIYRRHFSSSLLSSFLVITSRHD